MLYDPAQFDELTDEPWDSARVEDAIATIVADADAAFDPEALWPAHEWDGWEEPLPLKCLWVGAAGVIWALDALRRRGHAETSLDLAAAALRTLELKRAAPDFTADDHYHPAALLSGETGPLLVAFRLVSATAPRATGSRSSRRSPARATNAGWSVLAGSPSTRSARRNAFALRTAAAATHSGRATSARPSSRRPASTATPAIRFSTWPERASDPTIVAAADGCLTAPSARDSIGRPNLLWRGELPP